MTESGPTSHSLVVGSGAGGLTMAVLLAAAGRRVTLLEATPRLGGLLRRFHRQGVPFDTGFHFTGGFDHVLPQMLTMLGIADLVQEAPFRSSLYLAPTGQRYDWPHGIDAIAKYLGQRFPFERDKITAWYKTEQEVFASTPMFDLRAGAELLNAGLSEYDLTTVDEFLDRLQLTGELRTILAANATCHGTPPGECSVNHHFRISHGLDSHIARVQHGGRPLLSGFLREATRHGVTLRTGVAPRRGIGLTNRRCQQIECSDGSTVAFDDAFFAIHPKTILELLPPQGVKAYYREQVSSLPETCGFFTLYGVLDDQTDAEPHLTSCLETLDLNRILLAQDATATGIVTATEQTADGRRVNTVTAFASTNPDDEAWQQPNRNAAYHAAKAAAEKRILDTIHQVHPEYEGRLTVLATSSPHTHRDFIPPLGSAYGVRQRAGSVRLFGRLPVRNWHAIGQSALVPGVLGTMLASFLLFRQAVGEDAYQRLLNARLGEA
ncbi:MAG: NAD(P)-binding protein [Lentisphaeria bacterium]|jgi:phytoene dehydrogenase-like protein|nr:NAD(P)-binding protein [Lentisphaeria bacterium]